MKGQNRYAQLVEAQTPEPQESVSRIAGNEETVREDCGGGNDSRMDVCDGPESTICHKSKIELQQVAATVNKNSSSSSNSSNSGKLSENKLHSRTDNQLGRKYSRSSSQVSTTIVSSSPPCSTPNNSRRSSSIASSSVGFNGVQVQIGAADDNYYCYDDTSSDKNHQNTSPHSYKTVIAANGSTQLSQTSISKSMLALDKSHRMDRFEVVWSNLSFSYQPKLFGLGNLLGKRPTRVLNDVSGRIRSNQLIAVIGPSGCGKTTLLQFLAGNNPEHKDKMRIIGLEEPKVALIGQDDSLLPDLSARETLIYASRLQNNEPNFNHEQHVLPILTELGLLECADRSVTKLSGGQAKRVTIAQELLYPTNLLILDEVTSGLDASTSYSIIKLLKHLVSDTEYPMSIVISIHQPSAKLFSVFDQVYLMTNGCCLYEGSCQADLIDTHLSKFNLKCPQYNNIADYLIEVATNDDDIAMDANIRDNMVQYQRKRSQLQENNIPYDHQNSLITVASKPQKQGANSAKIESSVDTGQETIDMTDMMEFQSNQRGNYINEDSESQKVPMLMNLSLYDSIARARSRRVRPFCTHFLVHLERSFLRIRRSYILTWLQLITYILLGLQLATFYGPEIGALSGCPKLPSSLIAIVLMDSSSDEDLSQEMRRIQENMNFLLVAVMTATFAALEITVITFPLEAKTVKREWRNGWYRVSSYFMGRTVADLPFQLAFVIVFCVIIYTMTGQMGLTTWRFGVFVCIIVMIALIAQAVGFTFGALFMDNLPAAVFTAPLCIFPALLFSGFFSRVSQIPTFYKPMTFFSHFRYAFDALLVTLYGYNRCECDQETLTTYHANVHNQTSTIKDTFRYLFGSSDCGSTLAPDPVENSIEDLVTAPVSDDVTGKISSLVPVINSTETTRFKSIEDVLVDSVFQHMTSNSTPNTSASIQENQPDFGGGAMDHLASKFSTRITTMFNKQSNYGHEVPEQCDKFNSYLMTEFDLRNDDLIVGMIALFIAVILTRLICNSILNFTIATRTR